MARVPHVNPAVLPDSYDRVERDADILSEEIDTAWWNAKSTVRTFGNIPALAEAHVDMNVALWAETGLSPTEVEAVVLTVARALDAPYIWHGHVIAAVERADMAKSEILAISRLQTDELSDRKRALVEYVTKFVETGGEVSIDAHDVLADVYDDERVVGICMLAAYYVFLDHVSSALGLESDEEFVGWELENY